MLEVEELIRTLPITLLQIFSKIILNPKVIVKSIIDPDGNFQSNSSAENGLTLMLLAANLTNNKDIQKTLKMTETLANGYSSDSSQRRLSYEYPDDLVRMIFIIFCILVHLMKVASALERVNQRAAKSLVWFYDRMAHQLLTVSPLR